MYYYYSSIINHSFIKSNIFQFPERYSFNEILTHMKANMFDSGISESNLFVLWECNGKEIKSILSNSTDLQDYEQEQETIKQRLDFVENQKKNNIKELALPF